MRLDLPTLDATQLQQLMERGDLTSVSLVRQILAQIDRKDLAGLKLHIMISVASKTLLLESAAQIDAEMDENQVGGPLHRIPSIVKVCFNHSF